MVDISSARHETRAALRDLKRSIQWCTNTRLRMRLSRSTFEYQLWCGELIVANSEAQQSLIACHGAAAFYRECFERSLADKAPVSPEVGPPVYAWQIGAQWVYVTSPDHAPTNAIEMELVGSDCVLKFQDEEGTSVICGGRRLDA